MLETVDKNFFEIITFPNNLALIFSILEHNPVPCSLYESWNICFLLKYGLWNFQLESWNTNRKSLNRTLKKNNALEFATGFVFVARPFFWLSLCFKNPTNPRTRLFFTEDIQKCFKYFFLKYKNQIKRKTLQNRIMFKILHDKLIVLKSKEITLEISDNE